MSGNGGKVLGRADSWMAFAVARSRSIRALSASIALRSAAGSARPDAIVLPGLLASAASTAAGILLCKLVEKRGKPA